MVIEVKSMSDRRPRLLRRYASRQLRRENQRAGKRARLLSLLLISGGALSLALLLTISYFYISYSRLVDERLAAGYLASRAGIYAAPRVLRAGQRMERANLVEALRRAGYVGGKGRGVCTGRLRVEADQRVILPRRGAHADSASRSFEEVRLSFDAHLRRAELTRDGVRLNA